MSAPIIDRDGVLVPIGYPTHLIQQAREKADRMRPRADLCPAEDVEHRAVLKHLRGLAKKGVIGPKDFWWTPNEGRHPKGKKGHPQKALLDKRAIIAGDQDRKKGLISGVSDLILARRIELGGVVYGALALEMKRALRSKARTSQHQREWLSARREQGWIAEVCFGAKEAIELIHLCYGW